MLRFNFSSRLGDQGAGGRSKAGAGGASVGASSEGGVALLGSGAGASSLNFWAWFTLN